MSYIEKLQNLENRKDLARLLGFKPSALTSIVYNTANEDKYTTFEIPKKFGGSRLIKAPNPLLKKLQSHLAHILYRCLSEIENNRNQPSVSYGFREKTGITDNARNHKCSRYVLNIDLEDFFPSFNFGRVRGFFLKDQTFKLSNEVATTIAQIACDGEALPQGSPCSPVISELIGQILDLRMLRLAKKYKVKYSRYADDITFSTRQKTFPPSLAAQDPQDLSKWHLGNELINKVETSGFRINGCKTRMQCRGSRQAVTGLIVNEKVNIASDYYRTTRAMCHSLFQHGRYFFKRTDESGAEFNEYTEKLDKLEGILSHIYTVTQSEERRSILQQRKEPRPVRALYRRFLFYKYCIGLTQPLIITEGKTDPIYLREAIKYRCNKYPQLGHEENSTFQFFMSFFNYSGQACEIMGLNGGSGDLKSIVLDYYINLHKPKAMLPFESKPMMHPVIILLDNDDGLAPVASTIKKNFKIEIKTGMTDDFYHISDNLYLIKTPEHKGESRIEDLFPEYWKSIELNGKRFNPGSDIDPDNEYGKKIFAERVIRPNASKIDFSGFDPLLDRIQNILTKTAHSVGSES